MALSSVTALVTGAASGLGRATALKILESGGKVLLVDLPHLRETAAEVVSAAQASPSQAVFR